MDIKLPPPRLKGELSVEEAIHRRRSCRYFLPRPIDIKDVSQLLWAGNGFRDEERRFRTAPSAGKTHPLFLYLVAGDDGVIGLDGGVYRYIPETHSLRMVLNTDIRWELVDAALKQVFIAAAPVSIVITAEYERTTTRYRERGIRYVHFEVGHAGENIHLQALSLGLETVVVGAFIDEELADVLNLPSSHKPLYIMPVGYSGR